MSHDEMWANYAACKGMPQDLFFTKVGSNIAKARAVCADCPARRGCGKAAMKEEGNVSVWYRYGFRAYMTPAQRDVIEREGGLRGRDPMDVVRGIERRNHKRLMAPAIPDDGGPTWKRSYTTLARKIRRWLCENVALGDWLPEVDELCDALNINRAEQRERLQPVLDSLVRDGTLTCAAAGCYIRSTSKETQ